MADVTLEVTSTQINTGVKKANAINGTASEINAKLAKADSALQEIPNTYALKTDIPDVSNFATKSEVEVIDNKIGDIDTLLNAINGEVI